MKTRIIQTRFWDDEFVSLADIYTQHLYIYLLTSQYINISGIFQLPEAKIKFEAKLTDHQFEQSSQKLTEANKVVFFKGWVFVLNAVKDNNYTKSKDNMKAYEKEIENIPNEVLEHFNSSVDTSLDTNHKSKIINNKSEIRNKEQEIINNKQEKYKEIKEFSKSYGRY